MFVFDTSWVTQLIGSRPVCTALTAEFVERVSSSIRHAKEMSKQSRNVDYRHRYSWPVEVRAESVGNTKASLWRSMLEACRVWLGATVNLARNEGSLIAWVGLSELKQGVVCITMRRLEGQFEQTNRDQARDLIGPHYERLLSALWASLHATSPLVKSLSSSSPSSSSSTPSETRSDLLEISSNFTPSRGLAADIGQALVVWIRRSCRFLRATCLYVSAKLTMMTT